MAYWPYRFIDVYAHLDRIGVMVEFGCESAFAARMKDFRAMTHDIALQIAAQAPETVEQLLEQRCIRDDSKRVCEFLEDISQQFREKIAVIRFVRWTVGSTWLSSKDAPEPPPAPALIQRAG
jgi:elongation factor Ts